MAKKQVSAPAYVYGDFYDKEKKELRKDQDHWKKKLGDDFKAK